MTADVQLHQMARRHHATMKKLDGMREKFAGFASKSFSTIETGAGAWVGGLMDGKLQWTVSPVFGIGLILLNHLDFGGERYSQDYGNVGNGFLAGPLARAGYRLGQRLRAQAQGAQ